MKKSPQDSRTEAKRLLFSENKSLTRLTQLKRMTMEVIQIKLKWNYSWGKLSNDMLELKVNSEG